MDCPASMHGITSLENSVAAAGGCRTFLKQNKADFAGGTKEKADGAGGEGSENAVTGQWIQRLHRLAGTGLLRHEKRERPKLMLRLHIQVRKSGIKRSCGAG